MGFGVISSALPLFPLLSGFFNLELAWGDAQISTPEARFSRAAAPHGAPRRSTAPRGASRHCD